MMANVVWAGGQDLFWLRFQGRMWQQALAHVRVDQEAEKGNAGVRSAAPPPIFILCGTPAHVMGLPTVKAGIPSLETPVGTPRVCPSNVPRVFFNSIKLTELTITASFSL